MADVIDLLAALVAPSTTSFSEQLHEGDQNARILALETQVAALQRTVAALAEVLAESGAVNERDRRRVVRAARRPHEDFAADDDDDDDDGAREEGAVVGSPYRGGAPATGLRGCAVCGKRLGADDPELSLAAKGTVCTLCFTRGG